MATHFHQLEVADVRQETASCISVAFLVPEHLQPAFTFTQGQNITIRAVIEGEELRRSYSICSSPLDNELRIAINKIPGGKFSAWAGTQLKKGMLLELMAPTGNFYTTLDAGNKKNYLAFVAGSGITPVLSIIKTTLAKEPGSSFTLIYGNRERASIIFREELEKLKNKYFQRFSVHHVLSRENIDIPFYQGRINEDKCDLFFTHIIKLNTCDAFFLCGPEAMVFCVKAYLEKKGIDKSKIHFELFTVPGHQGSAVANHARPPTPELHAQDSAVTIKADGISIHFNLPYFGETILNAALRLGADLPFACKGGVCATCRAKLISGQVAMDNNYALETDEIKKGFILTCQSHPRSEIIFIDFDERS